jgi:hypothetical protein
MTSADFFFDNEVPNDKLFSSKQINKFKKENQISKFNSVKILHNIFRFLVPMMWRTLHFYHYSGTMKIICMYTGWNY